MKITIRKINKRYSKKLFQMQEDVFCEKIDKNLLRHNTLENFDAVFDKTNVTLGVFDKNKLVGFGILIIAKQNKILPNSLVYASTTLPCIKSEWIAKEKINLKLAKNEKIKSTTCLESCIGIVKLIIVKKEYRGHGFQIKILKKFDDFYKKFGIKCAICSVSPFNFFSLNNFYSNGFRLIYRKNLYDGYDRLILAKNVKK